jgi:hypothetical protein
MAGLRKTARPLKRRGGSREPNSGYEACDRFEGQAKPMKVRAEGATPKLEPVWFSKP